MRVRQSNPTLEQEQEQFKCNPIIFVLFDIEPVQTVDGPRDEEEVPFEYEWLGY